MEQFAGFTNSQFKTILNKLGYESNSLQTDEVNAFLAANPNASAKLGQYTMIARQMVSNKGKPRRGFSPGGGVEGKQAEINALVELFEKTGRVPPQNYPAFQAELAIINQKYDSATTSANNQATIQGNIQPGGVQPTNTNTNTNSNSNTNTNTNTNSNTNGTNDDGTNDDGTVDATYTQPTEPIATMVNTPVNLMTEQPGQTLDPTTGQISAGVPQVNPVTVGQTAIAEQQTQPNVTTVQPSLVTEQTEQALQGLQPEQGTVTQTVQPAQQDTLQQTQLQAAQQDQAQTVQPTTPRKVEQGEMISGSSVDMNKVESAIGQTVAQQAVPSAAATVQGQLAELTADFDAASPPAWAAGAMRKALASMASRGLGASSLAGQALIQSAMESAIPIAQADARTVASFEAQNLSNRQQTAMLAAQQRADFLKIDFNQDFQAKVANAAKISDIANMNFTAEQQIALENARMAQTVDLANLNNRQAKIMADAAALTQLDLANLNNRQQAQVQNAKAFLQMDLANLDNAQQTAMFKAQARQQALLSDQAATNASAQFNASSQNQSDQFFAKLNADIAQFNSAQQNGMAQFNSGQINSLSRFNAELQEQRAQFNASNGLIVAQANTQWRQFLSTTNTAAINAANMQDAKTANDMTQSQMDNYWQEKRDLMSFIWKSGENEKNRIAELYMSENGAENATDYANNVAKGQLLVTLGNSIFGDGGSLSFLNPLNWFGIG